MKFYQVVQKLLVGNT